MFVLQHDNWRQSPREAYCARLRTDRQVDCRRRTNSSGITADVNDNEAAASLTPVMFNGLRNEQRSIVSDMADDEDLSEKSRV
jgi:hypothetical protein